MKKNKMKRTDKVYRVTITSIPLNYFDYQIEQKTLLRVPYDVEINKKILENSGYFDDWWEDGNGTPILSPETKSKITFRQLEKGTNLNDEYVVVERGDEDEDIVIEWDNNIYPTLDKDGYIDG